MYISLELRSHALAARESQSLTRKSMRERASRKAGEQAVLHGVRGGSARSVG